MRRDFSLFCSWKGWHDITFKRSFLENLPILLLTTISHTKIYRIRDQHFNLPGSIFQNWTSIFVKWYWRFIVPRGEYCVNFWLLRELQSISFIYIPFSILVLRGLCLNSKPSNLYEWWDLRTLSYFRNEFYDINVVIIFNLQVKTFSW